MSRKDMNKAFDKTSVTKAIPRFIHQSYSTAHLPDKVLSNVRGMRALNPGWEYRFYDDTAVADFMPQHYGSEVPGLCNRINPDYGPVRADLFRCVAVYRLGGAYLDIKSAADMPLAQVVYPDDCFIFSQRRNGSNEHYHRWGLNSDLIDIPRGEYEKWDRIAAPAHPVLRAVIVRVLLNKTNYRFEKMASGRRRILCLRGPIAYTRAIYPLLSAHPQRTVRDGSQLGFRYSIFERDNCQHHKHIFRRHCSSLESPILAREFPRNQINQVFCFAKVAHDDIRGLLSRRSILRTKP